MVLRSFARSIAIGAFLVSPPVFAGEQGGTSSTDYWYGGDLHPLVITRDGVIYRLIGKNVVDMAFMLMAEKKGTMICNIHLQFPGGHDAREQSFFHKKCTNSNWHISWGYNDDSGSAVMTVFKYATSPLNRLYSLSHRCLSRKMASVANVG